MNVLTGGWLDKHVLKFVIPDRDSTEVPTIARASVTYSDYYSTYKNSNLAPADSESRDRQSMSARPRGRIPMGNSAREFESNAIVRVDG